MVPDHAASLEDTASKGWRRTDRLAEPRALHPENVQIRNAQTDAPDADAT